MTKLSDWHVTAWAKILLLSCVDYQVLLKITILYKWHLEQCAQCWSFNVSLNNYFICKSCHSWCNKDLVLCWSMEDVPEIHDYHDGNHDTESHHQCTGFCPRFPEIPVIWSHKEHPCTWRMFLIFLTILILIMMMTGVGPIRLGDTSWQYWCLNQVSTFSGCWDNEMWAVLIFWTKDKHYQLACCDCHSTGQQPTVCAVALLLLLHNQSLPPL